MTIRRSRFHQINGHEIHVSEWGNPENDVVILWHGLARTSRDFDELAHALSFKYFVIAPDTLGRGLSSWADEPQLQYRVDYYAKLAVALMDLYSIHECQWIGTSMGGLIGMYLAANCQTHRLTRLVLNDVGPELPAAAINRILNYASELPLFKTVSIAEQWFRNNYKGFGPASDEFWNRMARTSLRRLDDGQLTVHYDPRILSMLTTDSAPAASWQIYEAISIPTTVVWGEKSDLLTKEIVAHMAQKGPRATIIPITDCGHAPTLSRPHDIEMVFSLLK
ncbi:alpha/beta fold hydrolase [Polycladidibacter stylochi]|uniref:alpha/beta fold hydrolase n=1 Tax=Polycladidibacter stylochi TaxID=1807766 RepID=UPI000832E7D6|nr:alpha/beta hydrolase [Pseudovibrio stylochi]